MIVTGAVDAPLLPESAVLSDDQGNYVYIIDKNDTVVRRQVRTGQLTDEGVAIVEGLNGTERVVPSAGGRTAERRGGKERVRTCRSRLWPTYEKQYKTSTHT